MNPRLQSTFGSLLEYGLFWRDRDLGKVPSDLPRKEAERVKQMMADCLAARGGEVAARQQAAQLGELYLTLGDTGRRRFLETLVESFAINRAAVKQQAAELIEAIDDETFAAAASRLRQSLHPPQFLLLQRFNALPNGAKFLIDLRADLLRYRKESPRLGMLDSELRQLLATWFDVGFLEVERLTWKSSAALLEKLIAYEAVHSIRSWEDLHNRLESDRHCYAFFHPALPEEPLIFIEVALVTGLATSIQALIDLEAPDLEPETADTAIFYSISSTQAGLQGISFGPFLIKQVVTTLRRELPNLKTFSTLSPIPGFRRWLTAYLEEVRLKGVDEPLLALLPAVRSELGCEDCSLAELFDQKDWFNAGDAEALRERMLALGAHYLHVRRERDQAPLDPVARFHLGNGARIERLNWLGDTSAKGMGESCGLMVNYLYHLRDIEKNIEAYSADKKIAVSTKVRNLLRNDDEPGRLAILGRLFTGRKAVDNGFGP